MFDIASLLIEAVQKKAREAQQRELAAQIQAGRVPAPAPVTAPAPLPAPSAPPPVLARPPAESMPLSVQPAASPLLAALRGGDALIGGLIVAEVLAPPLALRNRSLPSDTL